MSLLDHLAYSTVNKCVLYKVVLIKDFIHLRARERESEGAQVVEREKQATYRARSQNRG